MFLFLYGIMMNREVITVFEEIEKYSLVIMPSLLKKEFLLTMSRKKKLVSSKIMTKDEFKRHYFFDYDEKTIFYCMEKYQLKYDIVLEYLQAMYALNTKDLSTNKLRFLKEMRDDLEKKQLLIFDPFFLNGLKGQTIAVVDEENLEPYEREVFLSLGATMISNEVRNNPDVMVSSFATIDQEISYCASKIKNLLDQEVPISHFSIVALGNEYRQPLKRIFSWYHLPLDFETNSSLYETEMGNTVLSLLDSCSSFLELVDQLKKKYPHQEEVINQLITIFNRYYWWDKPLTLFYPLLEAELKKTKRKTNHLKNAIRVISLDEMTNDSSMYYFVLGFNQENIPVVYQDVDILTDEEKQKVGLLTSDGKNIREKERVRQKLASVSLLFVSYKEKSAFNTYNPSLLIEEWQLPVEKKTLSYGDSHQFNQIVLAEKLDRLNKYGIMEEQLKELYVTYPKIPYLTYQNQFTGVNLDDLYRYLDHKLLLSYSSIDNFYRCSFRYYLANILKLSLFEESLVTNIGTIFHDVLSHYLDTDFDFEQAFSSELEKYSFSANELLLVSKLKDELKFDLETLKKQQNYTKFDQEYHEEKFYLPVSQGEVRVTFMGVIDKIMYVKKPEGTYLSIVDYKTGNLPDNLNGTIYGIGMQLPVYLHLLLHSNKFRNPIVVGIYLQRIINKELRRELGKSYLTQKENNLKLVGYSLEDEELLSEFDMTYQDSQLIRGMKMGKNGFYHYSKVLSQDKFKKLDTIVDSRIKEASTKILAGDFRINPKQIGTSLVGCLYCPYQDICFRREEDIVYLKEYKNLEFLGGEEDA